MIKAENSSKISKNPRNFPKKTRKFPKKSLKNIKICRRDISQNFSSGGILAIAPLHMSLDNRIELKYRYLYYLAHIKRQLFIGDHDWELTVQVKRARNVECDHNCVTNRYYWTRVVHYGSRDRNQHRYHFILFAVRLNSVADGSDQFVARLSCVSLSVEYHVLLEGCLQCHRLLRLVVHKHVYWDS